MCKSTKRKIRQIGIFLFIVYVMLLSYVLFFSEAYGRMAAEESIYRYNLKPFAEIRRFWVGFIPFGFILPVISRRWRSGFLIVLSGFCLSFCVETIQLVTKVGCFDVDDLILNTAGAAAGYLLFAVCDHLRRKHYGEKI